jgi:hypothetical protein
MGWLWGSDDKAKDAIKKLDPALREFLEKESPVKFAEAQPDPEPEAPPPPPTKEELEEVKNRVPSQSLYPDGRYAHIWKTYTPQGEVERRNKSESEQLADVLEGYKNRKAEIGRAALENCALQQFDLNECFRNGGIRATATMCRTENRSLERCYTMNGVCKLTDQNV